MSNAPGIIQGIHCGSLKPEVDVKWCFNSLRKLRVPTLIYAVSEKRLSDHGSSGADCLVGGAFPVEMATALSKCHMYGVLGSITR